MPVPQLFWLAALIRTTFCLPMANPGIEPASDSWAMPLADIGPLVMLVGERTTKQVLRDIHGFWSALSLAAAPLGLLTVVQNLIRIDGTDRTRALLGYELEPRTVAGLEITRVNCNGVNAEIVDGYLKRTTNKGETGVLGVAYLQGEFMELRQEVEAQLSSITKFESQKASHGIPETEARLNWCLQISSPNPGGHPWDHDEVLKLVSSALAIPFNNEHLLALRRHFQLEGFIQNTNTTNDSLPARGLGGLTEKAKGIPNAGVTTSQQNNCTISFMFSFEAISEFCSVRRKPRIYSFLIGMLSLLAIIALYLIEIWFYGNKLTKGILLVIAGYAGIVICVSLAALHIQNSMVVVPLECQNTKNPVAWTDGLVMPETSSSTLGASLYRPTSGRPLCFEAVWMRDSHPHRQVIASSISLVLMLSFICHYIGLRSSSWWLVTGELGICIAATIARSMANKSLERYDYDTTNNNHRIDWRCCSTGVILTDEAAILDEHQKPAFRGINLRIYAEQSAVIVPKLAEKVAWHAANSLDVHLSDWLLQLTGMVLILPQVTSAGSKRVIIMGYTGGVLVKEGLASPNVYAGTGFTASVDSLACPTAYFSRTIMRQAQWLISNPNFSDALTVWKSYYIPPIDRIAHWWGVSELMNGLDGQQENLQWACLFLNTAYFIALRRNCEADQELFNTLNTTYHDLDNNVRENSRLAVRYLDEKYASQNELSNIVPQDEKS